MSTQGIGRDWRVWGVLAVAALVAIALLEPRYTDLQDAPSALRFVEGLDHPARAVAAALADALFAVSYATVGVLGLQALGRGSPTALVGLMTVAFGAAADLAESGYLIANVVGRDHLSNDDIVLMQVFGSVKWVALLGYFVLLVLLLLTARNRWRARQQGGQQSGRQGRQRVGMQDPRGPRTPPP